jgi:uncharacterized membrane protein YhhN
MNYLLLACALVTAAVNWLSAEKGWKILEYLTKPAVMILLLAWLWQNNLLVSGMLWFSLGLVFSLLGDVLLMLPRDLFLPGLIAFLLAHIMYIIGFNLSISSINGIALILGLVFLVGIQFVYRRLMKGLQAQNNKTMRLPVTFYTAVISLMALSAIFTLFNPAWSMIHALIAVSGALLFVISDSLIAWNRFIFPTRHARFIIMLTYHLGQIGIILGAALHFFPT